jgi:hypothetical protein
MKVLARRVKSLAHDARRFVVEIGFIPYKRQNRRHVPPFFGRPAPVSSLGRTGKQKKNPEWNANPPEVCARDFQKHRA